MDCAIIRPTTLGNTILEEVTSFVYLHVGSVVNIDRSSDKDIKVKTAKARVAFNMLRKVWPSHNISQRTKVRIFNTGIKTVLLCIVQKLGEKLSD